MSKESNVIEELYFAFQIMVMLVLLNTAFPLFGTSSDGSLKYLSLSYAAFLIFRFYIYFIKSGQEDKDISDRYTLITGLLEGVFLLVYIVLKVQQTGSLSNLIFAYVLVQTIRLPNKKRFYFAVMGTLMSAYIYFMSARNMDDLYMCFGDLLLIFFIALSIGLVFREIYSLQEEKAYYLKELMDSNEKLSQLATTDYLTGLHNHKSFYLTINNFNDYMHTEADSLCMAIIDIDNFKRVNDTYGHLAGDAILSDLADIMKKNVRKTDFLARYGGEEFVIVFPQISLELAEALCERLRSIVENEVFHADGHDLKITISTGLSRLESIQTNEMKDFIKSVDSLLYKAKNEGKNRIVSKIYLS